MFMKRSVAITMGVVAVACAPGAPGALVLVSYPTSYAEVTAASVQTDESFRGSFTEPIVSTPMTGTISTGTNFPNSQTPSLRVEFDLNLTQGGMIFGTDAFASQSNQNVSDSLNITFSVTTPTAYSIAGLSTGTGDSQSLAEELIDLTQGNAILFNESLASTGPSSLSLDSGGGALSGVLVPGDQYQLIGSNAFAAVNQPDEADTLNATYGLLLNAPEPTSLTLLALPALSLLRRRRR